MTFAPLSRFPSSWVLLHPPQSAGPAQEKSRGHLVSGSWQKERWRSYFEVQQAKNIAKGATDPMHSWSQSTSVGQTLSWFCWVKGERYILQFWKIHVTTLIKLKLQYLNKTLASKFGPKISKWLSFARFCIVRQEQFAWSSHARVTLDKCQQEEWRLVTDKARQNDWTRVQ